MSAENGRQCITRREPDAANERQRAAEALKEWTANLVERAVKRDNTRHLDVLARLDPDSVDWPALAEQVLDHDGRGDRRTWDHEIPYDPFDGRPDRDVVWRLRERDGLLYATTREPAPESDLATDEAHELLVDDIDLRRHVESPSRQGHDGDSDRRASRGPDVTATPGTTGPRNARRGANEFTNDIGGDGDHSRGAGEPTLDPGKVHRELTPAEENPAPTPEPAHAPKTSATKRMREVTRPERSRTAERTKEPKNERDTERRLTPAVAPDDVVERKLVPDPPPPPSPTPAPRIDTGPSMGGP